MILKGQHEKVGMMSTLTDLFEVQTKYPCSAHYAGHSHSLAISPFLFAAKVLDREGEQTRVRMGGRIGSRIAEVKDGKFWTSRYPNAGLEIVSITHHVVHSGNC